MKGWNPFGKVDMEIGSFIKDSQFNKVYGNKESEKEAEKPDNKKDSQEK